MKVWQSFGNIVGILSETVEEDAMLESFVFLKKLEGAQVTFAKLSEFSPPQQPCPDCLFDGRHHS